MKKSEVNPISCKTCAAYIERGKKSGNYECRAFTGGPGVCPNKDARKK